MMHSPISRSRARAVVLISAAGLALVTGLAGPAAADPVTYTVTAGDAPAGTTVDFTGQTTGDLPQVTWREQITVGDQAMAGFTLNCASASLGGSTVIAHGLAAAGLASVPELSWQTCTGPLGISFDVTGSASLDAAGPTDGSATRAQLGDVHIHFADAGVCEFDLDGTIPGSYTNEESDGLLTLPGDEADLTASNVSGALCGLMGIGDGEHWSYQAAYALHAGNAAYDPIHLTSDS